MFLPSRPKRMTLSWLLTYLTTLSQACQFMSSTHDTIHLHSLSSLAQYTRHWWETRHIRRAANWLTGIDIDTDIIFWFTMLLRKLHYTISLQLLQFEARLHKTFSKPWYTGIKTNAVLVSMYPWGGRSETWTTTKYLYSHPFTFDIYVYTTTWCTN